MLHTFEPDALEPRHRPDRRQLKLPIDLPVAEQVQRKQRRRELEKRKPRCAYCGRDLSKGGATLDHVIPLSRGGSDTRENTVLACGGCNLRKGDRTPQEWAAQILQHSPLCHVVTLLEVTDGVKSIFTTNLKEAKTRVETRNTRAEIDDIPWTLETRAAVLIPTEGEV